MGTPADSMESVRRIQRESVGATSIELGGPFVPRVWLLFSAKVARQRKEVKMFWRREKIVRIELLSPPVVVTPTITPPDAAVSEKKFGGLLISLEQTLKLAAVMIAAVNTALVVLGYMRYVGLLQQFGVSRTEVVFSFSDLLSFGYVGFLNMTFSGQLAVAAVSSAITLPVLAVVSRVQRELHTLMQFFLTWAIATALFFLITAPYWIAYSPGKEAALSAAAQALNVDGGQLQGLEIEQEVSIESGTLTGSIILATADTTYLLKENVFYKIRSSDGKILRKTHLKAKLKPEDAVE